MKSVVVWGGTGFIGRHLIRDLVRYQLSVLVPSRRPQVEIAELGHPLVRFIHVPHNRSFRASMRKAIEQADVIYNLAGSSGAVASNRDPQASIDENCRIQSLFLQACADIGNRPHVVFASSRLVYGRADVLPVTEETPAKPQSYYAAHKLCVEHYHAIAASANEISFTICRISNPYGFHSSRPQEWQGFINDLIQKGFRGLPLKIFGDGRQLRDYLHVGDLIQALILCGSRSEGRDQIYNLGYGTSIPIERAAWEIRELTGAPVEYVPWCAESSTVESGDYVVNISKARKHLGFNPVFNFKNGLASLFEASRQNDQTKARAAGLIHAKFED